MAERKRRAHFRKRALFGKRALFRKRALNERFSDTVISRMPFPARGPRVILKVVTEVDNTVIKTPAALGHCRRSALTMTSPENEAWVQRILAASTTGVPPATDAAMHGVAPPIDPTAYLMAPHGIPHASVFRIPRFLGALYSVFHFSGEPCIPYFTFLRDPESFIACAAGEILRAGGPRSG